MHFFFFKENMEWNYFLLIFIHPLITESHADIRIIKHNVGWIKAHDECAYQGGKLADTKDIDSDCASMSDVRIWLGEEERVKKIARYGCYHRQGDKRAFQSFLECYHFCKSTVLGYRDHQCSCINTKSKLNSAPDSICNVFDSEFSYLWLYNETEKISNSTALFNCKYMKCPDRKDISTVGKGDYIYTDNCSQQLDGFACLFSNPENNTSVKPSLVDNAVTTIIEPLQIYSTHIQHVSAKLLITSSALLQSSKDSPDMTEKTSLQITLASSMNSLYDSSSEFNGNVSTAVQHTSSLFNKSSSSVLKNGSSILQTTVTSDLLTKHTIKRSSSKSVITSSIIPASNHLQMPTTVFGSFATITNTEEMSKINMLNTITMSSSSSRSHKNSTGRTSLKSTLGSSITTSPESSSSSSDVQHKSTVKTSMFRQSSISVSIHEPSNVGSSILPTSVKSDLLSGHASKHVPSISVITSTISTTSKNFQIPTTVSFATITNKEELSKNNNMQSTTTMKSNNSGSHQNSTGLIVGVSVSILVVLLIGVFGICRLRDQCPSKENTDDYTIPSTDIKDPKYQDIDFDLNKDTHVIENDSKHPMLATKGVDKQFLPTYNIPNGQTNMSNNTYAVVVKIPSVTNTTKAETNEDKNETKEISMHENDYNMLNKLRPISGNESSNLYDTSGERLDDNDPTYDTTTHMHIKERELESDNDHM